jgi:hypothetical protein
MGAWSYILAPFGLIGMWLAGKHKWYGWVFGLCTQTLWIAYAVDTRQYPFILGSAAYGFVYARNAVREYRSRT